jgi:type I restriction enzyme, S subunit
MKPGYLCPKGYKQTEVGVIPEEWEVKAMGEVLNKGRLGGNYPNQLQETDYPLIKMGNIARGEIDTTKIEYIGSGVTPEPQHKLRSGDVLFNTRNTLDLVGKVGIWRDELPVAYYNSNLMRLEFNPEQICSNDYANAALNANGAVGILRGLATGTTSVAAIYTRDLLGMPFIRPPLPEQRAIATALSDVDALLAALDRLIAKQRDLKQAAMQQLLTGQTRLPGFKGDWVVKTLGDICEIGMGRTPPRLNQAYWGRGYKWLSIADLKGKIVSSSKEEITELAAYTMTIIPKGTLLMSFKLSLGRLCFAGCDLFTNEAICSFNQLQASSEFLYYILGRTDFALYGKQAVKGYTLNKESLKLIEVQLPPLPEQTAIAEVLSEMDAELAGLEQRREKTRALKQGMMQELLTGRTRLL